MKKLFPELSSNFIKGVGGERCHYIFSFVLIAGACHIFFFFLLESIVYSADVVFTNTLDYPVCIVTDNDKLKKYMGLTILSGDLLNQFRVGANDSFKKTFSIRTSNVLSEEELKKLWPVSVFSGRLLKQTQI